MISRSLAAIAGLHLAFVSAAAADRAAIHGTVAGKAEGRAMVEYEPRDDVAPLVGDPVDFVLVLRGHRAYTGSGEVVGVNRPIWVRVLEGDAPFGAEAVIHASGRGTAPLEAADPAVAPDWLGTQGDIQSRSGGSGWEGGKGIVTVSSKCRGLESEIATARDLLEGGALTSWSKAITAIVRRGCRDESVRGQYAEAVEFAERERAKNERVASAVRANPPRSVDWGRIADDLRGTLDSMRGAESGTPSALSGATAIPANGSRDTGRCEIDVELFGGDEQVYFLARSLAKSSNTGYLVTSWPKNAAGSGGISILRAAVLAALLDRTGKGFEIVGEYATEQTALEDGQRRCAGS